MNDDNEKFQEFLELTKINRDALEDEWQRQPHLYSEVGEWASQLRFEAKQAKTKVDTAYSELYLQVLNDEGHMGLPKTTEAAIKAWILSNDTYLEAVEEYHVLDRNAAEASRLMEGFEQRKASLRDLVRLYVHEYYMQGDVKDQVQKSVNNALLNRCNVPRVRLQKRLKQTSWRLVRNVVVNVMQISKLV